MNKSRIEAFSDGVIAIIITIMVLELKVPHEAGLEALRPLLPVFVSYAVSFLFVGVYWSNHHNLLHSAKHATAGLLWANLHLLFWLSLFPFTTGWLGETWGEPGPWPVAIYGINLSLAGFAAGIVIHVVKIQHPAGSPMAALIDRGRVKSAISAVFFVAGIALGFVNPWISMGLYLAMTIAWLIPDRKLEAALHEHGRSH